MADDSAGTRSPQVARELLIPGERPIQSWLALMRARARQHERAQMVNEFRSQAIVLDQEAHVDGAVERIEDEVQIRILAEFAAADGAAEGGVSFAAARPQKAIAKRGDQIFVTLAGGENGRNDAPPGTAENLDQLPHLLAHVGVDRAGVWKTKPAGGTAGERVGDERPFVGPPAINRGLADRGAVRYIFDCEIGEAVLRQNFQRAAQNRDTGLFAARASGRALSATVLAVCGHRRLVAHSPNLPYNRAKVFRIRYAEYRI